MTSPTAKPLWTPSEALKEDSNLARYMRWLHDEKALSFDGYTDLWKWSTEHLEDFWLSLWEYFNVLSEGPVQHVLKGHKMPDYSWFEGTHLNYAEHVFRNANEKFPALVYKIENGPLKEMSWQELQHKVGSVQKFLMASGVQPGDRVVGYLSNTPEATIGFLAANSLGAVWSSCSPDFGVASVIDRFSQVEPNVLLAVNGYQYGGKTFDKTETVKKIKQSLPSLEKTVVIEQIQANAIEGTETWAQIAKNEEGPLKFTRVPFSHPIWILYSSGTTGKPKAITHSQGGILLEHLKYLAFHNNVKSGDRCFWYTTTGWMMWNYIQSALLLGATVVLYDGSPTWPEVDALWQLADEARINHLGTSAGYVVANMKSGKNPGKDYDLSRLMSIGSTGSPLPQEGFDWVYSAIKKDIWLTSISGGTDVCSAFVGGNPLWPVYSGEIQCRALGCELLAYDDNGNSIEGAMGEMVITKPMPSMPIYFWNDDDKARYKESYFDMYEGVWRHGDWTEVNAHEGIKIYGRSDATLNRGGVRIGTSEIYRAVDKVEEIDDSLIICVEKEGGDFYMPLFVKPTKGIALTDDVIRKINTTIKSEYSPRHVPDEIIQVPDIPYTISGKKTEAPVKKLFMGQNIENAMNKDALKNPEAMDFFIKMAKSV